MNWYEDDVKNALQQAHQLTYTPEMIFYGSSSIRMWDCLYEDFETYKPVNLGFGGSTLEACAYFAQRMLHPFRSAKQLVLYAGDNDLGDGKPPEEVLHYFTQLALAIQTLFAPDVQVFYLSIKSSIARWGINNNIVATNMLIKDAIRNQYPHIYYVNLYPAMLGENGHPNPVLYAEDGLHLSQQGYLVWKTILQKAFDVRLLPQLPTTA